MVRRLTALAACACALAIAPAADARSTSVRGPDGMCTTTGGGKFVPVPDTYRARLDRRLLPDVGVLQRKYRVFVNAGYAMTKHARNGEHPLGLAVDLVPNRVLGGTWRDVDRLARRSEPRQNRPRAPFRWVGYDGDFNHGRGNHLHLSWEHSPSRPGRPAAWVKTLRCPARR